MFGNTEYQMVDNNTTFSSYYNRLKLIAISLFNWEGLDDIGGDSRFLEMALFENGKAVFIKDETLGYLTLRVNPSDKLNVYNLPTKVIAYSTGYNVEYEMEDVVYIMNNDLQIPTSIVLQQFAYKLYNIDKTIDINLNAMKTPVILQGSIQQQMTLRNLLMQYDGNIPFIFGDKQFNITEAMKVLDLKATYLADKLTIQKREYWNEMLTFLGINNTNVDKKERLITSEVESNDEIINYYLNCFYKTRKKAVDEINKKFGLDLKLTVNKDIEKEFGIDIEEDFDDVGDDYE